MADVKISELPAGARTGVADLVPIVQGGLTVQSTVAAMRGERTTALHLYVDTGTGSDANSGLDQFNPLATLQAAYDLIYPVQSAGVYIHIGDGTYADPIWDRNIRLISPIVLIGDGAGVGVQNGRNDLATGLSAGVGSGLRVVEGTFTATAYDGAFVMVTAGPRAGVKALIQSTTTTTLTMVGSPNIQNGDIYTVYTPTVKLSGDANNGICNGASGGFDHVFFALVNIAVLGPVLLSDSDVVAVGVQIDNNSFIGGQRVNVNYGDPTGSPAMDSFFGDMNSPDYEPVTSVQNDWVGWGAYVTGTASPMYPSVNTIASAYLFAKGVLLPGGTVTLRGLIENTVTGISTNLSVLDLEVGTSTPAVAITMTAQSTLEIAASTVLTASASGVDIGLLSNCQVTGTPTITATADLRVESLAVDIPTDIPTSRDTVANKGSIAIKV